MRPLTDEETKIFFTKLANYIGPNIKFLLDRSDEAYVFRMIKDRVYYMSEKIMLMASNIARENLLQYFYCFKFRFSFIFFEKSLILTIFFNF